MREASTKLKTSNVYSARKGSIRSIKINKSVTSALKMQLVEMVSKL